MRRFVLQHRVRLSPLGQLVIRDVNGWMTSHLKDVMNMHLAGDEIDADANVQLADYAEILRLHAGLGTAIVSAY
jgi:hypothetical protein